MFKQFCTVCGNEVISQGHLPLDFCTNCGARLPRTQGYAPVHPTIQMGRGPAKLTRGEKTMFGALIAIPVILILAGIGMVALLVSAVQKKQAEINDRYPTPRPSVSPQKTSNSLLSFGRDGIGQGEFKYAESLAVDRDGNIYVGDGTLRIQKFDSNGKFLQLWNVTESKIKADEKYTKRITHLAIDSKNRLYAAVGREDLLRYDAATGKFIDRIELYGEKWMNRQQEANILDMVMLNDDRLAIFASSFPEGEYVIMVSPEGKHEIKFRDLLKNQKPDKRQTSNGSLLVTVTGEMYLLDGMTIGEKSYIYRFKPDGGFVDRFTWDGAPDKPTFWNKIIALNSKGEIFAFNNARKQIHVLNTEGVSQRTIPLNTSYFNKMILDARDNIYILNDSKIEKFSPNGV